MFKASQILMLCLIVTASKCDYCENDFKMADFPQGILKNVLSILLQGSIHDFAGCSADAKIDSNHVNLWLWNQGHPDTPVLLDKNDPSQIDRTLPTIILIPGWLCNVTNDRMPELRKAYLQKFKNANLIGIDWSSYSISLYDEAFCYVPLVAKEVGKFICHANSTLNVDVNQLHLIGHSMGGQMTGLIGQEVKQQCGHVIGRITAADPAGPLYQNLPISRRLDGTDAARVDVIHSNQMQFGYHGSCGTVDFFPNCGYFQPGCLKVSLDTNTSYLLDLPLGIVNCNHLRGVDYMVESVNSDNFKSTSCAECPGVPLIGPCIPDIIKPSHVPMGEPCPSNPPNAKYVLSTNSESPYARGL